MQEFRPGDTINNRYKVVRRLGAGAMGCVYLCEDPVENNIKVALKVLFSENLDDQDIWAKGEYEALTRLRHPNLARVYNFGKIGDTKDYFIISEFIKGIDLYTATEYVNYEDLNDIVVQICRALEYIHSQGYVHFDIKPDNILVTRHKTLGMKDGSKLQYTDEEYSAQNQSVFSKPNVKLIDFGLAEKITGSFNFAIKGTLNYLAPEIINGTTPDKRADLYSLGVTLYQVTNRDLPFYQDPNLKNVVRGQKRSDLFESQMKKHPEYLRVLIMKLLEEKPEERFQTAKEVIQYLNKTSGKHYDVETKETQASYLYCPRLVGRRKELTLLKDLYERIFFPHRYRVLKSAESQEMATEAAEATDSAGKAEKAPESSGEEDSDVELASHEETVAEIVDPDEDLAEITAATGKPADSSIPSMVLISGEMGMGKSRLLEEFHHFLKLNDIHLYVGNCYEGKSSAYQPIVEILRSIIYEIGLDSEIYGRFQGVILKLLPELVDRQNRPQEDRNRPVHEKLYFIDRISQFFIEVAEQSPFALTINNLHWGDEVTVELLETLVERICEKESQGNPPKIMILVSLRIDELCLDSLKRLLARLRQIGRCQEVQLRRLKRTHLVEILQTILSLSEIPSEFLDRLEEKTGGNPFFLIETLKALQDEGILKNTGSGWTIRATNYDRVEIPHSLEEMLLMRVKNLEPVKRELLEMISVLNKPVSAKILAKFKQFKDLPILVQLRDLEEAGLVSKLFEGGKLEFQIDQPKMREIIYSNLEPAIRRRYHGMAGELLTELYSGHEEEVLEELAYHFQKSDQTDRALELASSAGDRLKAIYANDRAFEYYLYIIEKIEGDPTRHHLWIETHEKLGDLCTTMGKYDVAERSYENLLQQDIRDQLDPETVSRCYRKKGKVFEIQGDYDNALKCYKEARNFLAHLGDSKLVDERIRVFNCIGWVYVCMGKYEKAMTISLEGLRVIQGDSEKIEHSMIFNTIGSANYYKGNISRAIEFHSRSLKIRENLENIPEVTTSLNNLGSAYLANAEYGEAMEHFKRALASSEEIGDPYGRAMTLFNFARVYHGVGSSAKAEKHLRESLRLSKNYNMRFLNMQNYILLGLILHDRNDNAKAEGYLFRALTSFSKQGNRWGLCTVILDLIEVHRQRKNFAEAKALADEALRYATDLDIDYLRALSLLAKARLMRDSGEKDLDTPFQLLTEALAATSKVENPEILGQILSEKAEVLIRMRRLQEAQEHFRVTEEKFRAVLDRLPKEFRASYQEKHKDKFTRGSSVHLAPEIPPVSVVETPPAEAGAESSRGHVTLRRVNELMQYLNSLPQLREFLNCLLQHMVQTTGASAGLIFEWIEERLHPMAAVGTKDRTVQAAANQIRLPIIQDAMNRMESSFSEKAGIFPFSTHRGTDGVVYLENLGELDEKECMILCQSYLNLIPIALFTLPGGNSPMDQEVIEVQPEELLEK